MTDFDPLSRLARQTGPSKAQSDRIKNRIMMRLEPSLLRQVARSVEPSPALQQRVKMKMFNRIGLPQIAESLKDLSHAIAPDSTQSLRMRQRILSRIQPLAAPLVHTGLKWSAAFAVLLFVVRFVVPLAVLAPRTEAETVVQLIPEGAVSMLIGGVWVPVTRPEIIHGPVMVRTEHDSKASIYLHDDAVVRLASDTTLKLHDLANRPQVSAGPTATLVRGQIWALSLIPAVFKGISIDTVDGTIELNEASISLQQDTKRVTAIVYDRAALFTQNGKETALTSGEEVIAVGNDRTVKQSIPVSTFQTHWATENLTLDSAHRTEIIALQEERRQKLAGILPTSYLYPVKRAVEQMDVLLTFNSEARAQKQLALAETRLNEAAVLLKDPATQTEAVPLLSEYRDTLIGLATGSAGNLVQFLINKQIADTSASIATDTPDSKLYAIKEAVLDVSKAIPNTDLKPNDVAGYVLVDKLIALNTDLQKTKDASVALGEYSELQPYIKQLLDGTDGAHPLLQAEARSLLAKTSTLLSGVQQKNVDTTAVQEDIRQYMPEDTQKREELVVTEEQIDAQVNTIISRALIFELHHSRVNQLLADLRDLKDGKNPNRGTILRRLYRKLPRGLAEYARVEIEQFSDELKSK